MRRLAIVLALGFLTAPLAAGAQSAGRVPRIGFLSPASPSTVATWYEAFRQALRDLGYVEGQNIVIEWRWAEEKYERLPDLAAELVRLKVDVIVTHGAGRLVAKRATATIPIVLAQSADPVGEGLVASLARPGGNVTGSSFMLPEIAVKRLDLLKEAVPAVSRVAVLFNRDRPEHDLALKAMDSAARALKVALRPIGVRGPDELERAFAAMAAGRANALAVLEDAMFAAHARRLADLALKQRLPSAGPKEWPEAGGLLAIDSDPVSMFRRAAVFVDKILKGAKPADLPIEQTTQFKLIINLGTAKALGLTIPPSVLARADHVIP
jgi:putative ABC transport system substrate-binding protein